MPFNPPPIDLIVIGMPAFLMAWAMVVLFVDLWTSKREILATLSCVGLLISALIGVYSWGIERRAFYDMVILDQFGTIVNWVLLGATFITILMSLDYLARQQLARGEFYPLLLFATAGMMLLVQSNDLVMMFIGVELLSIALYVLTGFAVPQIRSGEAAMKYLLLGAFAAGFLVYGIALVYGFVPTDVAGASSSTSLNVINLAIATRAASGIPGVDPLLLTGMSFVLIALGFKVSLVPFHAWTPDVYEGAPTPVSGYMSVATKGAAFVAILRTVTVGFGDLQAEWQLVFAVLAALTMIYGNVVAVAQSNLKRMLAYSSIAHAGYMLMGVLAATNLGAAAFIVYLIAYSLTNLGAFAVITALERNEIGIIELKDLRGLGRRRPQLAVAMVICMFSLAGMPLTAGFIGKFAVFQAAWVAGLEWLVLVGVITSIISAFFYLRVTVMLFMEEPEALPEGVEPAPIFSTGLLMTSVAIVIIGILLLGIIPTQLLEIMQDTILVAVR